ncbi:MAG: PAS domain S-box protein, partial [Methanophagales archaeon]|nr:PAS domain S-box protein [Methanophagales archaeon]
MKTKLAIRFKQKQKYRILIMTALLGICCALTYYFHVIVGAGTVFTHFFYVPIILASLWWRRKGLVIAVFLALLLIFSHFFVRAEVETVNDLIRAPMFIVVALAVAILSARFEERAKDLAKEHNYTRHLIESSPDFQMTLGKDGRIMDVNKAFEYIVGKNREDVIGTSIFKYLPKEETEKAIAEIFEKEKVRDIELTADIPGKGTLICNFSGTVFTTPEGEKGIYATGRDVTERNQVEEKLRLFSQAAVSSIDGVAMGNLKGRITYANETFARMFGHSREELIGKEIAFIYPEDQIPKLEEALKATMEGGWTGELVGKRKNGELFPMMVSSSRVVDDEGKVIATTANHRDITEHKKQDELLRNAEEDWRNSFNSLEDVMLIIDTDYTIENINDTGLALIGKSKEEVIGKKCYQVIHDETSPAEFCPFRQTLKTKKTASAEWYAVLFGKHFSIKSSPIFDENGEIVKFIDLMVDITEQKWAETEREALIKDLEKNNQKLVERTKESEETRLATLNMAQDLDEARREAEKAKEALEKTNRKLEMSNRELQDFVYIASHDLREPMRKISAFGQLLQESLKGKLDEDEQENLEFMIDGATRMQRMIDALLTYSRVTTKAKPAKRVDLNETIEDLKRVELAVLLEETGGTIRIQKPLPAVQADSSQVHQLLQNLIANGLKFNREGITPEITVRGRRENESMVRVEVEDNGIGIDEENHEKIFVMFQRFYSRYNYKGAGIGLAVCKKIVEHHGGSIGLNSTPGKGSTFW